MHAANAAGQIKVAPEPTAVQHTPQHAPPATGPAFACINRLRITKNSESNDTDDKNPLILKLC
jgi:hypothetical protein